MFSGKCIIVTIILVHCEEPALADSPTDTETDMAALKADGPGRLCAAHINHRLRGQDSADDEAFVSELCGRHAIPLETGEADVSGIVENSNDGLEAAARNARYDFLRRTALRLGARYVVTAHTADDQAETILHRIIRGTGVAGSVFEFFLSGDIIDGWDDTGTKGAGRAVNFTPSLFSAAPYAVASLARRDGADGGWLRRGALNATKINLTTDEDKFTDAERTNWHFVPNTYQGVCFNELDLEQRRLANALLQSALSSQGYLKTQTIMRLEGVLRREAKSTEGDVTSTIEVHDLIIHPGRHEVLLNGRQVDLTFTEFRLLQFLARKPGWAFSRSQIVDAVKGEDYPVTERSVDVQVAGLRKKMGDQGRYIETVRGVGYRFKE